MKVFAEHHGSRFSAYHCDTVEFTAEMPRSSVDFSIYSPPFASLYVYSQSERDMGNVGSEAEFAVQYAPLVKDLYRVTRPGRLTAVHCSDLPRTKTTHGIIGLYDFPADIRLLHEEAGWTYHSRITVWKDPVVEMQRTKALGLLYKQLQKDATRSRQGMPDYVLVFRKTPDDETHSIPVAQDAALFPVELGLIERAVRLWSNPGETVFSPFMGIGSEGYGALKAGRRFVGTELKDTYYCQAVKYLTELEGQVSMQFEAAE
jgi:DNA modification methylase